MSSGGVPICPPNAKMFLTYDNVGKICGQFARICILAFGLLSASQRI
jgi:hypothetical protein